MECYCVPFTCCEQAKIYIAGAHSRTIGGSDTPLASASIRRSTCHFVLLGELTSDTPHSQCARALLHLSGHDIICSLVASREGTPQFKGGGEELSWAESHTGARGWRALRGAGVIGRRGDGRGAIDLPFFLGGLACELYSLDFCG